MVDTAKRIGQEMRRASSPTWASPSAALPATTTKSSSPSKFSRPRRPPTSATISLELSAWMFFLGERTTSLDEGRAPRKRNGHLPAKPWKNSATAFASRAAIPAVIDDPSLLPAPAQPSGSEISLPPAFIADINCLNLACPRHARWWPRKKRSRTSTTRSGLEFHKRIGDSIKAGETLVTIAYNADAQLHAAQKMIEACYQIGE